MLEFTVRKTRQARCECTSDEAGRQGTPTRQGVGRVSKRPFEFIGPPPRPAKRPPKLDSDTSMSAPNCGLLCRRELRCSPSRRERCPLDLTEVATGSYLLCHTLSRHKNSQEQAQRARSLGRWRRDGDRAEIVPPQSGRSPLLADAMRAEAVREGWLAPAGLSGSDRIDLERNTGGKPPA
jgi:hypothetical protein